MIYSRRFYIRHLYCSHLKTWLHIVQMLQAEIKFTQLTQLCNIFVVTDKDGCFPRLSLLILII